MVGEWRERVRRGSYLIGRAWQRTRAPVARLIARTSGSCAGSGPDTQHLCSSARAGRPCARSLPSPAHLVATVILEKCTRNAPNLHFLIGIPMPHVRCVSPGAACLEIQRFPCRRFRPVRLWSPVGALWVAANWHIVGLLYRVGPPARILAIPPPTIPDPDNKLQPGARA